MMDGGAFEILWTSHGSPGDPDSWSIQRRPFAPDGSAAADQSPVNTSTVWGARPLDASMTRHGDMVAAWDTHAFEVRARIFRNTLFVDGLETGGVTRWSLAQP